MGKTIRRIVTNEDSGYSFRVFDVSISDLEKRKALALTFPTARAMCLAIGMHESSVANYTSKKAILAQKKFYSERHEKTYAIRYISKNSNSKD